MHKALRRQGIGPLLLVAMLFPAAASAQEGQVELQEPDRGDLLAGEVTLQAMVEPPPGVAVESVRFRVNGRFLSEDTEPPFQADWRGIDTTRDHLVRATALFADETRAYDLLSIPILGLVTRTTVTGDAPDLVLLSVTILDRKGEPITDLQREEVLVLEDGRRQEVEIFESEDRPLAVQLLLDASDSTRPQWRDLSRSTRLFAETLRAGDRAGVEAFNHLSYELAPLGSAATEIEDATADFDDWGGGTLLYEVLSRTALFTLGREETGRRAVILLTDGADSGSDLGPAEARNYLQRTGIQTYSIVWHQDNSTRSGSLQRYSVGAKGHQLLERLAVATGGDQMEFMNRPMEEIFLEIGERLRSQYLVGYTSLSRRPAGKERDIEIRLRRMGSYTVKYRRNHFGGQTLGEYLAEQMSGGDPGQRRVAIRAASVNQDPIAIRRIAELVAEENDLSRGTGLEARIAMLRLSVAGVPHLRDLLDTEEADGRDRIGHMLTDVFILMDRSGMDAALEESVVILGGGERSRGLRRLQELLELPLPEESRDGIQKILTDL